MGGSSLLFSLYRLTDSTLLLYIYIIPSTSAQRYTAFILRLSINLSYKIKIIDSNDFNLINVPDVSWIMESSVYTLHQYAPILVTVTLFICYSHLWTVSSVSNKPSTNVRRPAFLRILPTLVYIMRHCKCPSWLSRKDKQWRRQKSWPTSIW